MVENLEAMRCELEAKRPCQVQEHFFGAVTGSTKSARTHKLFLELSSAFNGLLIHMSAA